MTISSYPTRKKVARLEDQREKEVITMEAEKKRISLDTWAVIVALVIAFLVVAINVRIPW